MEQRSQRTRRVLGRRVAVGAAVAVSMLGVVGCASESSPMGGSAEAKLPPSAAPGPAGASQRTSLADASVEDITAALKANGVDDPAHWSKIIANYKPYPRQDVNQSKLRTVLQQNRADGPTIDKITNAVVP